jgi:hypothetical protein
MGATEIALEPVPLQPPFHDPFSELGRATRKRITIEVDEELEGANQR